MKLTAKVSVAVAALNVWVPKLIVYALLASLVKSSALTAIPTWFNCVGVKIAFIGKEIFPSQVSEIVPTVVEGSSIVNSSRVGDDTHPLTVTPSL